MNQFSLMSQQNSVSIFLCWSCLILCFASHTWTWNRNTLETVLNHEPDIRGCYYCEIIEKSLLHMLLVLSVCWERWLCWCCLLYCTESAGIAKHCLHYWPGLTQRDRRRHTMPMIPTPAIMLLSDLELIMITVPWSPLELWSTGLHQHLITGHCFNVIRRYS